MAEKTMKKWITEKCKNCYIVKLTDHLTFFECKGIKEESFCDLHYDPID